MNQITTITQLSDLIRNNKVRIINYIKKDGTSRDVYCTLDFDIIPKEKYPKENEKSKMSSSMDNGLLVIFDLDRNDWRSLVIRKIKRCKIEDEIYTINIKF